MRWFTINFNNHVEFNTPKRIARSQMMLLLKCAFAPVKKIMDYCLYKMQHDGSTISLEKVLNEYFGVVNYASTAHDATKKIYIGDVTNEAFTYIHQDDEVDVIFLEDDDDDNEDDIFLDNDSEGHLKLQFIIFIPDTIEFDESRLRAMLETYRYVGTTYTIETYTL